MLDSPIFWLIFVNLIFFAIAFLILSVRDVSKRFSKMPRVVQQALVIPIVVPEWVLPLFAQPRFRPSLLAMIAGLLLLVTGAVCLVAAFRQIGLIPSKIPDELRKGLITAGIYGVVRNPIYSANIAITLGFALVFRGLYALAYVPVVFILFTFITVLEEKELREVYGDQYVEYQKKVPYRFFPKVV